MEIIPLQNWPQNHRRRIEGTEQSWRTTLPGCRTRYKATVITTCGIDERADDRPMEQHRAQKQTPTNTISPSLTKTQWRHHEQRSSFQQMALEQLDIHEQNHKSKYRPQEWGGVSRWSTEAVQGSGNTS